MCLKNVDSTRTLTSSQSFANRVSANPSETQSASPRTFRVQGRLTVSIFASTARTLCLIAAVGCGPGSANPYPTESRASVDALAGEIASDQLTAVASKSKPDKDGLARLAVLAPSQTDRGEARTPVLSEPFGLPITATQKWGALQSRIRADEETLATCRSNDSDCPAAARAFLRIIEQGHKRQGRARIGEINRAINLSIKFMADSVQHGIDDVWSAPLDTFATGAGDCEDYAIAKYLALRESGTVADDLRLVIVRDIRRDVAHAVVAVRFDGEWLILDNRHLALVSAAEVPHYSPLFVLDHRGVGEFMTAGLRR
jgi:predicted transglutaminase-like cysteine proteinase